MFKSCFSSSTPDQWEDFSNVNILDAENQRQNSVNLRSVVDGILQSTCNDMLKQKECVDIAMTKRIAETRDSKEKLEDHLSKVNNKLEDHLSKVNNKLEDHLSKVNNKLEDHLSKVNNKLEDHLSKVNNKLEDHLSKVNNKLEDHLSKVNNKLEDPSLKCK